MVGVVKGRNQDQVQYRKITAEIDTTLVLSILIGWKFRRSQSDYLN